MQQIWIESEKLPSKKVGHLHSYLQVSSKMEFRQLTRVRISTVTINVQNMFCYFVTINKGRNLTSSYLILPIIISKTLPIFLKSQIHRYPMTFDHLKINIIIIKASRVFWDNQKGLKDFGGNIIDGRLPWCNSVYDIIFHLIVCIIDYAEIFLSFFQDLFVCLFCF